MSSIAIRAEHIGKEYRIGRAAPQRTLREAVADAARSPFRLARAAAAAPETVWALRDISFEVTTGEVLGIIGHNGAGKSTLLKVLSRITEPTTGRVEVHGRVGSLLEVGTGFHPELTGRDNIYLNGSILGMDREYITRRFEEIVEFSGVGQFIDTPVKRYSSGMYLRLAFAVAAHLEPEILILDEVLAVGDAAFQKKCLAKMGEVAREGRTVLFVSHNLTAVQSLCTRALWVHGGIVREEGRADRVVSQYLRGAVSNQADRVWNDLESAPGDETVRLHRARVLTDDGTPLEDATVRTPLLVEFEFWNRVPGALLNLSVTVHNEEGLPLFNTVPIHEREWHGRPFPGGLFRSAFRIPGDLLNDGGHRVELKVVKDQSVVLFHVPDVLVFDVKDAAELRTAWFGKWEGALRPGLEWSTQLVRVAPDR